MPAETPSALSIYHLIDGRIPCGASIVTKELVHALQQEGIEVEMLSLYPGPLAESAQKQGHNVRVVQGRSAFNRWRDLVRILREARARGKTPVIHSHQLRANRFAAMAARRTGTPHVISVHTHKETFIRNQFPNPVKRQIMRFIHYRTLDRAAARVAVSQGVLRELNERGYVGHRTQLVRNILTLPDTSMIDAADRAALRADLAIPEHTFTILAAGRLVHIKRFDLLIRAIPQLKAALGDVVIMLAGDGPLREELEQQAAAEGVSSNVRFLGWQNELAPYIAACDCVVSCSQTETVAMVLVEAMSMGRPVVAAAVEDVVDLVLDNTTGLLFPVDNFESMCNAIVSMAQNPELVRQLEPAAREHVQRTFDRVKSVREMVSLYENVTMPAEG